jgi:hypothetical protein
VGVLATLALYGGALGSWTGTPFGFTFAAVPLAAALLALR